MATTGWFWLSSALCAVAACAVPAAAGAKHPCLAGWERGPVNCSGEVLIGVDLRGAHMPDSRFDGAYLAYSNLDGAYLSGSTFDSAFLNKVTLDGVHASGITMRFATLVECKMRHAVLDFADLTGVSSMGCEISLHSATDAELPLRNKVHMPLMPPAVQWLFVGSEGTDRGVAETKETTFPRILASARDVVWIGFTVFTLAFLPYLARKSEEWQGRKRAVAKAGEGPKAAEAAEEATAKVVAGAKESMEPEETIEEEEEEEEVLVKKAAKILTERSPNIPSPPPSFRKDKDWDPRQDALSPSGSDRSDATANAGPYHHAQPLRPIRRRITRF